MLREYTQLVQQIKKCGWDSSRDIDFEVGPDGRYYLVGNIENADLVFRNQMGFDNWQQANEIAVGYGYNLPWEN